MLEWLNTNQGAVTAGATGVIALASIVTAWITATLAKENRLLRKAGTEPEVVAYLMTNPRIPTVINLVFANIGQGPALNLEFKLRGDEADFTAHKIQLRNNPDRRPFGVFPQAERMPIFFGTGPDLLKEPPLKPFVVELTYADTRGRRRTTRFDLDIAQFKGILTIGRPADHEIAEALKQIAERIREWSNGFNRLKVEVITTNEAERRVEEQYRLAEGEQEEG
jgi:hypothetical protein